MNGETDETEAVSAIVALDDGKPAGGLAWAIAAAVAAATAVLAFAL